MPLPASNPTTPVKPSASLDVIAKYRATTGAMTAIPMIVLPIMERKPIFFRPYGIYFFGKDLALLFLFGISRAYNALDMLDDRLERGPRSEIAGNSLLLQQRLVLVWDNTATHQQNIAPTFLPDELCNLWEGGHVSTV